VAREAGLVQGTLDMLVLKALAVGPKHGFGVARWIEETTAGRLGIEEGALYPSLHRILARGWITAEWGLSENNRRARYYRIKPAGRRALARQTEAWELSVAAVAQVLAAETGAG